MGKGKPDKNRPFTVNLKHEGLFTIKPFAYINYDEKQITDLNFEGTPLKLGIKEIRNDDNVQAFLTCGYESKWVVDLYAEHLDEDALECRDRTEAIETKEGYESSDAYCSSDDEEHLGDVEFFHEGDENVEIKNVSTKDPFLNKLCSNSGQFKGFIDEPVNVNAIEVLEDPDHVDAKYKAKPHIIFPRHDPTQDWDKMEPILGMRFESNEQLKLALGNYGVHNGDVEAGRCAGAATLKKRSQQRNLKDGEGCSKDGEGCSKDGEGSSKSPAKVPKKGRIKRKAVKSSDKEKDVCGFRLFASWMSTENSFQIKSLKPKHKCSRNYNLGSLVTYKWIAHHFAKELIEDPFIPLLKMQTQIRTKCHINVSIGQCQRAKQRALFDYEGGLKEHYARLWEYRNGLERAVSDFLPNAEHIKCTRHLFANFKRKFSGVELQRLFWQAASTTVQDNFYSKMDEMKVVNQEAYDYLIQRNPNSWSRAFFCLESKCPNFENGICESFNRAILVQRTKPIITMLEDIILYVMQRLVAMNRTARLWEDTITPSIRKRLNKMIEFQLRDLVQGVHDWYSQQKWFEAYQFSIRPVYGSTMWKRTRDPPLLPPLMRTMLGRPKKKRIIAPDENTSQVVAEDPGVVEEAQEVVEEDQEVVAEDLGVVAEDQGVVAELSKGLWLLRRMKLGRNGS
ncbi:hypothetical protein CTI12_AA235510 [Artemisia annua]|uniref:Transposase, MuDR, MULE transposase domain protein n=1 Tax=Artemisia annua TaxID=35608 RepID=A0A2U1NS94_ARTAN|nr:hypothetical protein CTI12_AA235510 [Artemisia annua]